MGETSAIIRSRGEAARQIQRERFDLTDDFHSHIACNADRRVAEVRKFCQWYGASESLVRAAMSQMNLSARGSHRVLKLARTTADLAGSETIQTLHVAEALRIERGTQYK